MPHIGTTNSSRSSRATLGFLVDWLEEDYQQAVFGGIVDTAVQHDCNLLCFAGGALRSPHRLGLERNFIYDLAGPDTVDALLVMGGSVGHAVGLDGIRQFCESYRPLPVCSIALEIPSVPSVLVDNARGMHDAILHLIMHHGFRRLAFIRGPEANDEAERRFGVYCEVLRQHSIPFDPGLVPVGDFLRSSGAAAARQLCSARPGGFEAILAASDAMALGAMDALADLDIRVPEDVAVVGFDDIVEARFASPSLTTVRQPLYEQGARATETVLEQLNGGRPALRSTLLTEIVLRRSCGCFSQSAMAYQDTLIPPERLHSVHTVEQVRPLALSAMQHAARGLRVVGIDWKSKLFDALVHDLEESENPRFLAQLEELLHLDIAKGSDASAWHDVITALRGQLLPTLPVQRATRSIAESLLQHARLLVTSFVERIHVRHRLEAERWVRVLSETNEAVITTFDAQALTRSVADQLPRLGIQSCYLALFEPSSEESLARLIMAYDALSETSTLLDVRPFRAKDLLPEGMFPRSRRVSFIVEPLFFRQQRLGFALFEMGPRQGIVYEALRDQISAALKGAMLVQEVVDKNHELEEAYTALKENQEKLLASEKTAGIGRLTASIAHEMNSPVAAVRAALLELEKLITEYRESAADSQVTVADHQEIAAEMGSALRLATSAAERAADFVRSIKNQTRDTGKKERVRFDAVASVRESLLLLGHLLRKANCAVRVEASADILYLVGPPGRLGQVVTNLVTNAIDAMAPSGGGMIDLSLIKDQDRITLCVSDRGHGVSEEIRERIWDPLFTTKPFGQGTGLGLTIVRDIVAGDFGGSVAFEPRADGGARFRVELPTSTGDDG